VERVIVCEWAVATRAKVIVNGGLGLRAPDPTPPLPIRAELQGQDPVGYCYVYPGFNSVLLKVEHGTTNTPGIDIQFVDPERWAIPAGAKPYRFRDMAIC